MVELIILKMLYKVVKKLNINKFLSKSYQKEYRENMSDEQKQRYRDKQKKI